MVPKQVSVKTMLSFSQLQCIFTIINIIVLTRFNTISAAQMTFSGELTHRPVRDPDGPLSDDMPIRRAFWSPLDAMCKTSGSTAGALAAHRLIGSGQLSPGQHIPGHVLLDLRSFVSMVAGAAIRGLDTATACPLAVLQSAAEEMCMMVICASGGVAIPRERCLAYALEHNGVLNAMPNLKNFLPKAPMMACSSAHFNFRIAGADFNANPQLYANQLVSGVFNEVREIHQYLIKNNARPIDLPPPIPQAEKDYMIRIVQGAVIATHVGKVATQNGYIAEIPGPYHHDVNIFLPHFISLIVKKIGIEPFQEAMRAHNVALKMTLYWVLNNYELLKQSPPSLITGNSLMALGISQYFPQVPALITNNELVNPQQKFIVFPGIPWPLEHTCQILDGQIPVEYLIADIESLVPKQQITVPESVITMQVNPLGKPSKNNLPRPSPLDPFSDVDGAKGTLPNPEDWFSVDAPTKNATTGRDNAALLATLATIIGAHAGRILPKLGIVTRDDEKGYLNLDDSDAYQAIQKINQQLVSRLMSVLPLSLDTGFAILNGAFKTTKLMMNLENPPEANPETKFLIPLGLKHNGLLQFYPNLQGVQWDLYPLPEKMRVLHLWVKPNFNIDINDAINKRILEQTSSRFPKVLSDIVAVLKQNVPTLTVYNIRILPSKIENSLPWDPPEAISYLYDPSTSDGVPTIPYIFVETPKKSIECPGHLMCPADHCASTPCGHYVCASSDPWCYFPDGIKCPGSIQCPILMSTGGKLVECPASKVCPITYATCPGGMECSDSSTACPGNANCPLLIRCPGAMCPTRYSTRPVPVLPCPQHSQCQRPPTECLLCQDDMNCASLQNAGQVTYNGLGNIQVKVVNDNSDVVAALRDAGHSISASIDKKEMSVQINNTAVSHVSLDGEKIASGASGTVVRNNKAAAASGASAAAHRQNKISSNDKGKMTASAAGSGSSSPGQSVNNLDYPDYVQERPAAAASSAHV